LPLLKFQPSYLVQRSKIVLVGRVHTLTVAGL